jgi:hypothetical protein
MYNVTRWSRYALVSISSLTNCESIRSKKPLEYTLDWRLEYGWTTA